MLQSAHFVHPMLIILEIWVLTIQHVDHSLALVERRKERGGNKVSRQHRDSVLLAMHLNDTIEEGEIFQLVHIIDALPNAASESESFKKSNGGVYRP